MKILNEIEAILFLKGKELEIKELQNFFKLSEEEIMDYLKTLKDLRNDSGLNIRIDKKSVSMITNPIYGETVYMYFNPKSKPKKLSKAALETLTIIAYNEAMTKSDIEKIRGVSVDGVVNTLAEKKLVKVVGIKQTMGNPKLYAVTDEFLKYLNIDSIEDLPNYEEVANAGKNQDK